MRVHLDTDLGGDPDDVCALAYLLARSDVELVGVTTVDDPTGLRAGCVGHVLALAGREDVPVAAGAGAPLTPGARSGAVRAADWPSDVVPRPGPIDAALDLVARSVAAGAVVVGIGPATTLATAERRSPGLLGGSPVVVMGGWLGPPAAGFPPWGPADDWNVVCDPVAATELRRAAGRLTVVPLAATVQAHLRAGDLSRLRSLGPLGELMAEQSETYRVLRRARVAREHPALPDDLANFHHDPLAAAVAVGWDGVTVRSVWLRTVDPTRTARLEQASPPDPDAREVALVTDVDGPAFAEHWLTTLGG